MKNDKRKKPRWLQAVIAYAGGCFWLPCPICGQYFGGQEESGSLYRGQGRGTSVCVNCAAEAERRSIPIWKAEGAKSMWVGDGKGNQRRVF